MLVVFEYDLLGSWELLDAMVVINGEDGSLFI